jgi:hypothetical protein
MQRKKSQNINALRKPFENIIIFKERLMNIWKNLIKVETQDKNSAKYKGNGAYPEAKHGHGLLFSETPLEAHSHQFLTQNSRKGFW